jgi:hypothetical protein
MVPTHDFVAACVGQHVSVVGTAISAVTHHAVWLQHTPVAELVAF